MWNQCLSPLTLWVRIPLLWSLFDTTLCDKVCQWLAAGRWFSLGTDRQDITELLLKVVLYTITLNPLILIVAGYIHIIYSYTLYLFVTWIKWIFFIVFYIKCYLSLIVLLLLLTQEPLTWYDNVPLICHNKN